MRSKSPAQPPAAAAGPAGLEPPTYQWMRPLAVIAIGFVATTAFQTDPAPGAHGRHLAVSAAIVVLAAGTVAAVRLPAIAPKVQLPLLVIVVLAAGALVGLQPAGPGFLGVFPAVSAAALRLPSRAAAVVATIAVAGLAVAWTLAGHRPVAGVVLNEFGVVAFYLLATFARRYRVPLLFFFRDNNKNQLMIVRSQKRLVGGSLVPGHFGSRDPLDEWQCGGDDPE